MKNKNYQRKAFIQIFLGYFISVSIFILLLGFLYFNQQKTYILQQNDMNIREFYYKQLQLDFKYKQKHYSFDFYEGDTLGQHNTYKKDDYYYTVFLNDTIIKVDASLADNKILEMKIFTIIIQILLITFFALVSFILTRKSLKPMIDTISHLDRFTKDLIHDLNTPVTSILLNTRMLKKEITEVSSTKVNRIESSANNISSLYENLEILLYGDLDKENLELNSILNSSIDNYEQMYTHIDFNITKEAIKVKTNKQAIKRILDNIVSNACKYSKNENAKLEIIYSNNTLTIKDNGKGIKYANKIFEREYKESDNGHGIGMHIVFRLCDELGHNISIESKENIGTSVKIVF